VNAVLGCRLALFGFLHRQFGTLESKFAVRAIAERLVDGASAAAQRERCLSGQVVFVDLGIYHFDRAFWGFHTIGSVLPDCDFDIRHSSSGEVEFRY